MTLVTDVYTATRYTSLPRHAIRSSSVSNGWGLGAPKGCRALGQPCGPFWRAACQVSVSGSAPTRPERFGSPVTAVPTSLLLRCRAYYQVGGILVGRSPRFTLAVFPCLSFVCGRIQRSSHSFSGCSTRFHVVTLFHVRWRPAAPLFILPPILGGVLPQQGSDLLVLRPLPSRPWHVTALTVSPPQSWCPRIRLDVLQPRFRPTWGGFTRNEISNLVPIK